MYIHTLNYKWKLTLFHTPDTQKLNLFIVIKEKIILNPINFSARLLGFIHIATPVGIHSKGT